MSLPKDVAKKYQLRKGLQVTEIITKPPRISVNLRTITLKQADDLYEKGYDIFELIATKKDNNSEQSE